MVSEATTPEHNDPIVTSQVGEHPDSPISDTDPAAGTDKGVRIKISTEDLSFDVLKSTIYTQVQQLHEHGHVPTYLLLSSDIYEILNKRLVFKTAAHKEHPHLITPYGNLLVMQMTAELDQPLSFIIE